MLESASSGGTTWWESGRAGDCVYLPVGSPVTTVVSFEVQSHETAALPRRASG